MDTQFAESMLEAAKKDFRKREEAVVAQASHETASLRREKYQGVKRKLGDSEAGNMVEEGPGGNKAAPPVEAKKRLPEIKQASQPSRPVRDAQEVKEPPAKIQQEPQQPPVKIKQEPQAAPVKIEQEPQAAPVKIKQEPQEPAGAKIQQELQPPPKIKQERKEPPAKIKQEPRDPVPSQCAQPLNSARHEDPSSPKPVPGQQPSGNPVPEEPSLPTKPVSRKIQAGTHANCKAPAAGDTARPTSGG